MGRNRSASVRGMCLLVLMLGAPAALADEVRTIAGNGAPTYAGDGGPALSASLFGPHGVAVAPDGTIFFADSRNRRIRRITPVGVIDTIAGSGMFGDSGNGGPATAATFSDVLAIALDARRNQLYLTDTSNNQVRRIDLTTGLIHLVAHVGFPQGIAVDAGGSVYVAETPLCQVLRIDPDTGAATRVAGTDPPSCDHSGDGGPATAASFYLPTRLAIDSAGHLFVIDLWPGEFSPVENHRVRRIDAATGIVTTVAGGGADIPGVGPATSMHLGVITAIAVDDAPGGAGRLFVANEFQVFVVNLATGELSPLAGTGVSGFQDGPAADAMFNVVGGLAYAPTGVVAVGDTDNNRIRAITPGSGVLNGDLRIIGTTDTEIVLTGVTRITGDVAIVDNDAATVIDLGNLETIDGSLTIEGNAGVEIIDLGSVQTIDGSLTIVNNAGVETIDLSTLQTVDGSLTIENNAGVEIITLESLETISGNLTVESHGTGTFDAAACVGGISSIDLAGYAGLLATAAPGGTTLTLEDGSVMQLELQPGTFPDCVSFSISRTLFVNPEAGVDENGDPVLVDLLTAYQFIFAVPTLGLPATLSFDIVMSTLDPVRQVQVLEALNAGVLTLTTRGDNLGPVFQTFPVCAAGQEPTVDGCVRVQALDATGNLTTGTPAIVRFTGIVGHFSTWAVAIVRPAVFFNGLLQPYPAPPRTATPTFKRGSVVPLKFNFVNAADVVVDSAAASPAITIYPGSCSSETPATDAIVVDDAGQSGGWRYDADSHTWIFGWDTKPLAAGCYWIQLTTTTAEYPGPSGMFPIALRDR